MGMEMGVWQGAPSSGTLYLVEMDDFFFDPPGLFLQPGDRVRWVMRADRLNDGHSATAYHPDNDKELRIPEGAEAWSSGLLRQIGQSYQRTFTVSGVHDYFCIPHETDGMVGRIIVQEATGPGTKPLDQGVSPAGQSAMPTIEELLGPVGQVFNLEGRINLVLFKVRGGDRPGAQETLAGIIGKFKAGAQRADSLYQTLGEVNALDAVLADLDRLSQALADGSSAQEVTGISEALKTELDQAAQQFVIDDGQKDSQK